MKLVTKLTLSREQNLLVRNALGYELNRTKSLLVSVSRDDALSYDEYLRAKIEIQDEIDIIEEILAKLEG